MTLSIIIVSYNVKYFLEQCLCSVKEAIKHIDAEVFVIDNDSDDETPEYLKPFFSWINFVGTLANEGFAKANNRVLDFVSGDYVLFLNPDTILAEDSLERCLSFYRNHEDAGAVGVRMIDGSGVFLPESKRSFPSPIVAFYKMTGLSALFHNSKKFGRYSLNYLPQYEVHEVDVISGAFMMVPKPVLAATGGFDERFFMYAEDIDLSYRIQKAGFRNYYLGDITLIHFKGESTKKESLNYIRVFYNAMILFVKKWYPGAGSWLLRKALQVGIFVRGSLSAFALPFRQKQKKMPSFSKVMLAGDIDDVKPATYIVKNCVPDKKIFVSPEIERADCDSVIIFCMGRLNYKNCIAEVQKQEAHSYRWFGKDSRGIAGSDSKHSSGEVWSIDQCK